MSELEKIFLTSSLTIIGGIIIYVVGQIILKFFIEPIHKQSEIVGDISDALVYYAREYSSPGRLKKEMLDEAHNRFRQLASILKARSYTIKYYNFFEICKLIPKIKSIEQISSELIGLANSVHGGVGVNGVENSQRANKIRKLLNIPITD